MTLFYERTELDVINMALDLMGEPALTTLDDHRALAQRLKRLYPESFDRVSQAHDWPQLWAEVQLPALADAPKILREGYGRSYDGEVSEHWATILLVPADALKIIAVNGETKGWRRYHGEHQAFIGTMAEAPVTLSYVRRVTPAKLPSPLVRAIAADLAIIAGRGPDAQVSGATLDRLQRMYDDHIAEALALAESEGGPKRQWVGRYERALAGYDPYPGVYCGLYSDVSS